MKIAAILVLIATPAWAQTVTRGPYLQEGTPHSVVVRWRTSTATNSRVRFGTVAGALDRSASDGQTTTEHVVRLTGLSPDTRYHYAVGTSTADLAGNDAAHFFVTSPPSGVAKATRVWVLGDSGTADSNAAAVRNAYAAHTGSRHTDLWLMLGDNAYNSGTDGEYQDAVFDMYPEMLRKSVLWATLGNHDGQSADSGTQSGVYYNVFTFPKNAEAGGTASGTEAYYSFDYGNIHFVCLDSYDTSRSSGGAMAAWLQNDLAQTSSDWIIAFWHHPPYSKGSHDSDSESNLVQMRQVFLPILEAGGVDLVLAGHSHAYERSYLIDGHYGSSGTFNSSMIVTGGSGRESDGGAYRKPVGNAAHEGAVYVVAGSSGQVEGVGRHPAMYVALAELGSMVLDIDGNRLDAKFLRNTGAIRDSFTILKPASVPPPPPPPPPDGGTGGSGGGDAPVPSDDDDDDGCGLLGVETILVILLAACQQRMRR